MSEQQEPSGEDIAWFTSKMVILFLISLVFWISQISLAVLVGGVMTMVATDNLIRLTGIPAGLLIYFTLDWQRKAMFRDGVVKYLLPDAVKLGFEPEATARKLAGLPPPERKEEKDDGEEDGDDGQGVA